MIIETIYIYDGQEVTIDELQDKITNGEFNDILAKYSILTLTASGVVKIDKDSKNIILNPLVDLTNYALKSEIPKLAFDENGNLNVTIGDITKKFTAIAET